MDGGDVRASHAPGLALADAIRSRRVAQGWHALSMAWQKTKGRKKTAKRAGTCYASYSEANSELITDVLNTILPIIMPAIKASRDMLPSDVRPKQMTTWSTCETGCSYLGVNITPDRSWGLENFTWDGTFDELTGKHHGIRAPHPYSYSNAHDAATGRRGASATSGRRASRPQQHARQAWCHPRARRIRRLLPAPAAVRTERGVPPHGTAVGRHKRLAPRRRLRHGLPVTLHGRPPMTCRPATLPRAYRGDGGSPARLRRFSIVICNHQFAETGERNGSIVLSK